MLQLGWEKLLKELQLKVITAFVAGQDVLRPSNRLWEKLMLCMSTTTLRSSLSVGKLTKINSDCCNAIKSYHGKSSLVSLFYAIKVATIKSAFVTLGSPTESEHRLLLFLGILEISSR